MSLDKSSPPPAKQAKLGSTCEIKDLSDADLAEIFKHLPPLDRLFISAVCKRWNGISRAVWADVTHLDLSPIPGRQIAPIISQCPNLNSIVALNKIFALGELYILTHIKLHSLKLYNCEATILAFEPTICDAFSRVFSSHLRSASWRELVLHNFLVNIVDLCRDKKPIARVDLPASLPTALRRLQISDALLFKCGSYDCGYYSGLVGLEALRDLECLAVSILPCNVYSHHAYGLAPGQLESLRELFVGRRTTVSPWRVLARLTRLEVLFVDQVEFRPADYIRLMAEHRTLRILVITGDVREEVTLPNRRRYPNGSEAAPVSTLHVFVGKSASGKIRFPLTSNDTLKIYPISEPLPQFLNRADVAPIFEGVWLAAKIKEAAKHCADLSDYESDVTSTIHHADA